MSFNLDRWVYVLYHACIWVVRRLRRIGSLVLVHTVSRNYGNPWFLLYFVQLLNKQRQSDKI